MKRWNIKVEREITVNILKEYHVSSISIEKITENTAMISFILKDGASEITLYINRDIAEKLIEALKQFIVSTQKTS